jgi:hypothetical protein
MKNARPSWILWAIVAMSASLSAAAAGPHDHRHEAAPATLQLDKGRKWPTDAPLRQAMTAMRGDLASKLHAIHKGSLAKEEYAALGKSIEAQIGTIISQCKLEPRADAMLHIVIGQLGGAADVMQAKAPGDPAEAAHRAVMTLNDYGRHFAHPGWKAIK